jgi:2-dehydropantoate 2-reductase
MPTHITHNIYGYLWGKLVYGSMAFAVSTIDAPVPDVLRDPRGEAVSLAACLETARVGTELGYDLQPIGAFIPSEFAPGKDPSANGRAALKQFSDEMAASIKQHMGIWRDLKVRKRKTEVDVQCGEVVRHAAEIGIQVPVNRAITEMVHSIENGECGMTWDNLDTLAAAIDQNPQSEP